MAPKDSKRPSDVTDLTTSSDNKMKTSLSKPYEHTQTNSKGTKITGHSPVSDLMAQAELMVADMIQNTPNRDISLKEYQFVTDEGRTVHLDLNAAKGPLVDSNFERNIFKTLGYIDVPEQADKVHMIAPPDYDSDTLGYALFEKGGRIRDSEAVKTILEDNFMLAKTPQVGDRVFYKDSQGNITFGGWVERVQNGRVTETSSRWRDGGSIWQHHPDLPKEFLSLDNYEVYHRKKSSVSILDDFKQIGGNIELKDKVEIKIILLLETHSPRHETDIAKFIDSIADNNDIILAESPEGEGDPKIYSRTKEVTKSIRIFGWDNTTLFNQSRKIAYEIEEFHRFAKETNLAEASYSSKISDFNNQLYELGIKRNESLFNVLNKMHQNFPDKRKILIAGRRHFTHDPVLREKLNKFSYIALTPIHELTKKELEEAAGLYIKEYGQN